MHVQLRCQGCGPAADSCFTPVSACQHCIAKQQNFKEADDPGWGSPNSQKFDYENKNTQKCFLSKFNSVMRMSRKFLELLFITLGSHSVAELAEVGFKDCTAILIYFEPRFCRPCKAMSKNAEPISITHSCTKNRRRHPHQMDRRITNWYKIKNFWTCICQTVIINAVRKMKTSCCWIMLTLCHASRQYC